MKYVKKGQGVAIGTVVVVTLFAVAIMASSEGSTPSRQISPDLGMLQLALVSPDGVDYIDVELYRGTNGSKKLADNVTLASGVYSVLFPKLAQDAYSITASAYDGDGALLYQGTGSASVVGEVTSILTILLNHKVVENTSNRAPRIDSFEAFGRTVEGIGDFYVLAPKKNEPVQLTAVVSDDDGDAPSLRWTVTDSPSPGGVQVGTMMSDSHDSSIIWKHDQEGTYWINIFADDGNGGAAAFTSSITVLNNEKELNVQFFFNAFPTVVTSTKNEKMKIRKNSFTRKVITLDATGSVDPDGDPVTYLWSTDCSFAKMTGVNSAEKVALVATKEETCVATVRVFDTLGYNTANVALDICCQEGEQSCGVCSQPQRRISVEPADLKLSSSSAMQDEKGEEGCLGTLSDINDANASAGMGSQASAGGMCRI